MQSIAMGLGLWLPDEVQDQIARAEDADRDYDLAVAFRKVLKGIDERLDIIWVKHNAPAFPVGGRWYIVRYGEFAKAKAFWVVSDPDGNYCPPTPQHLEALQARDSHAHPDVWKRLQRTRAAEQAAKKQAWDETRREFREKLLERLDYNHRVQIAVSAKDKAKL